MTQLFNRQVAVTITKVKQNSFFDLDGTNQITVRDLRVKFKIEKTLGETPNTCNIEIYNLAETTRAALGVKPLHVRIDAGYKGEVSRLFVGDMTYAPSTRDGNVDWVTKITVADGGRSYANARTNKSFSKGVDVKGVVSELAKSMGLTIPTSAAQAKEFTSQFVGGLTLNGPSRTSMTKVLGRTNKGWSVQDGQLQILGARDARAETAIVVSQKTGMVGSPSMGPPGDASKPPTLTVKMLLYPGLTPGGKIQLESVNLQGLYRISKVTHTGDTRGNDWYSDIEATPL